jgi:hypothetical protein
MKAPFTAADAMAFTETWEEKILINIFNGIRDAANEGATSVVIQDRISNNMLKVIRSVGFIVQFELGFPASYRITWEPADEA